MCVFSRRAIQDRLDLLQDVLSYEQHAKLVDRLNLPGRDRLAAMWETVFLQALSQVVAIRHEVELPNGRRPDFEFEFDHGSARLAVGSEEHTSELQSLMRSSYAVFC